jgi:hypothetical protein
LPPKGEFDKLKQHMKFKLLSILLLVIFISCKNDKPKINKNSKFVKTWFDTVRMTPFTSELTINENNTFDYSGGACSSSFESKGIWKIEKNILILNSLKTKKCIWKNNFGLLCSKEDFDKIIKDNKTIKNCNPNSEKSYIIFNNEKFHLRNDTLIHIEVNKNCPKLKIAFSNKKKIRKNI